MRVLITGAKGFIGRHLAKCLSVSGHHVMGIGHGAWPEEDARVAGLKTWLNGEIRGSNLQSLVTQAGGIDVVFHLAGGSSVGASIAGPREDFSRTVATTVELLEWVRMESPATRVIAVSSAAVYGAGGHGFLAEDSIPAPCSPYGHHKLMLEQLCRSYRETYQVRASAVRLFSVYGRDLQKQLLWDICSKLHRGIGLVQLGGTGAELRDWTAVEDVARALMFLAEATNIGDTLNVGTGIGTSVERVFELILKTWPKPAQVTFSGETRRGDPFSLVADVRRLNGMGFECTTSVDHGICAYVNWFLRRSGYPA